MMNRCFLIPVLLLCFGHTSCEVQTQDRQVGSYEAELVDVIDGNTVELYVSGRYVWAHLDGVADTRTNEDFLWEWFDYNLRVDVEVLSRPYYDEWVVYLHPINGLLERREI